MKMQELTKRSITGFMLILLLGYLYFYFPHGLTTLFIGIITYLISYEYPLLIRTYTNTLYKALILIYIVTPFLLLILLNHSLQRLLLCVLLGMVFIFDSASYLSGTIFGHHPISRTLSPKKTWEGVIGGCIITLFGTCSFLHYYTAPLFLGIIPFTMFTCSLAFLGDLFESFLKRKAQLKDSGSILPGHGGILDRFDSILLISYFFYFFREPLIHFLGL